MAVAKSSGRLYRFGDLLALARQSWMRQMREGVADLGYHDYRRSDAAVIRALARAPLTIAGVGATLGVTRQAARKVVDGLEARGLVTVAPDESDGRAVSIRLSERGEAYARAVVDVIERLNGELASRVGPEQLRAADSVLRAVLQDEHTRHLASRLAPPSGEQSGRSER